MTSRQPSDLPAFNKAIVRVNVFRNHRQVCSCSAYSVYVICHMQELLSWWLSRLPECTALHAMPGVAAIDRWELDQTSVCFIMDELDSGWASARLTRRMNRWEIVTLQTVQYIQPQHHARLGQAELLVIDEAAAIPLPLVKAMLGPYLVFLCSTVNGYEGGALSPMQLLLCVPSATTPGSCRGSKIY